MSAPTAVPNGWRPIETAPKDGTILLYLPDSATDSIVFGYWSEDDGPGGGGCWYEQHGDSAFPIDVDASHWMPLPTPPEVKS